MFPVLSTQNEKAPVCLQHWDMGEASSPLRLLGSLGTRAACRGQQVRKSASKQAKPEAGRGWRGLHRVGLQSWRCEGEQDNEMVKKTMQGREVGRQP